MTSYYYGVVTTYTYGTSGADTGNLIQVVQDPGGLNRVTTMHYDAMGRVLSSTDPLGQTSAFSYNALGQPVTVATPARGTAPAETITYAYAANGRTNSVTDNRGVTTMNYETGSDRVSSVSDPVTGTVGYTYRISGERLTMTLPGGGTWSYAYTDTSAAWQNIQFPCPSNNGHFNSGAFTSGPSTSINGVWYMPKGDPDGLTLLPASVTDDQGRAVVYTLNYQGMPLTVDSDQVYAGSGARASYLETTFQYDTYGGSSAASHGWLAGEGTAWHGTGAPSGGQPVSANAYTYDTMGQRLTDAVTTGASATRTEAYGYDALSRLKTVDYGDGQTQGNAFDPMGNRLSRQDSAAGTTNYAYNAANMLTGSTGTNGSSYTNDQDGDTLSGGGRTCTWDSQNRMVSCTVSGVTTTYTYGADGLRRSMTTNGVTTYYAYDGQTMIREMQGTPGSLHATATYLAGPRGPEYRRDDTQTEPDGQGHTYGKTRWYVYDGLGSVVGEVDPLGNVTCSDKYDVYGAVRGRTGTASTAHGFVGALGHLSDAATGLVYMRARYYDPATGRFASQDPAASGSNWFAYCEDNPLNEVDQTGKNPLLILGAILGSVILGAITSAALAGLFAGAFEYGREYIANNMNFDWGQIDDAAAAGVVGGGLLGALAGGFKGVELMALASIVPLVNFPAAAVLAVALGVYSGELWGAIQLTE